MSDSGWGWGIRYFAYGSQGKPLYGRDSWAEISIMGRSQLSEDLRGEYCSNGKSTCQSPKVGMTLKLGGASWVKIAVALGGWLWLVIYCMVFSTEPGTFSGFPLSSSLTLPSIHCGCNLLPNPSWIFSKYLKIMVLKEVGPISPSFWEPEDLIWNS